MRANLRAAGVRVVTSVGLLLALATLLAWSASAQSKVTFAWLSDTHIGSSTAEADLRAAVEDINTLPDLDCVIISGDVTEYGSLSQLLLAREVLRGLKIPWHVIPGNHDMKWSESGGTDFSRVFGADRFAFRAGGFQFIGMHQGPVMKMGDGHWAPQDVRWLRALFERLPSTQPIVFISHYPIDSSIANWYEVLDLLKTRRTQIVLCGHGHANRKLDFEGIPGLMGRSNLRAKRAVGGYSLVELTSDKMTVRERVTGTETKAAWADVGFAQPRAAGGKPARPDFAVNSAHPGVRKLWTRNTGFTIASAPAVWRDLCIVGDASGTVRAFELQDGSERWNFSAGAPVYSTPSISGDTVAFASTGGEVIALRAGTGKRLWSWDSGRPIVASPALAGGAVYVGTSEGKFVSLRASDGKKLWEFSGVSGFVETKPLLYDGKVVFGAWDQHLYALDAASGSLAWKWNGDRAGVLFSPAACWPVAAHGKVFIAAPDRFLSAIEITSGKTVWRTDQFVARESVGLSLDASHVYIRSMQSNVVALATESPNPQVVWKVDAGFGYDINSAMLAERDGIVYYGTKNGVLIALDAESGALVWRHRIGVALVNTLVPLGKGAVLATDLDGQVTRVQAQGPK